MKSESVWPCIESKATDMLKAQKHSKNVSKTDMEEIV